MVVFNNSNNKYIENIFSNYHSCCPIFGSLCKPLENCKIANGRVGKQLGNSRCRYLSTLEHIWARFPIRILLNHCWALFANDWMANGTERWTFLTMGLRGTTISQKLSNICATISCYLSYGKFQVLLWYCKAGISSYSDPCGTATFQHLSIILCYLCWWSIFRY